MKIPKLFKKAAAFVMAAVTALSIMPATAFAAGDIGTISFSHTYDSNGNAMRYNSSANIGGYTAGGTGNYKYRMFVDGENAFCIQPGVPLKTGNTLKKASSDTWNALSANQKKAVGLALLYGYQGNRNNLSGSDDEKWLATQTLVWEFVTGCREATGSYNQTSTTVYSLHFGSNYANSGARAVYDQIVAMLREHNTIPSFMSGGKNDITKELAYKDGKYSITLTDSNGVLSDYSFSSSDSNVSVSKSGNKLTISSTVAISGSVRITAKRNNVPTVSSSAKLIAYAAYSGNQQDMCWLEKTGVPKGRIGMQKVSSNPTMTEGNGCYSLEGAVYGVYDKDSNLITKMTTNAEGKAVSEYIPYGTYWLKEIETPKGFALNPNWSEAITLNMELVAVTVEDIPQNDPINVVVRKQDADAKKNDSQGNASLQGAEFTVKYYKGYYDSDPSEQGIEVARSWVLKTDEEGICKLLDSYKVSGDDFYKDSNGYETFPLGTVTIQETKAPSGYLLDNQLFVRQIKAEGIIEAVDVYNEVIISEKVIRGGVSIEKWDFETKKKVPQGSATLSGAEFTITNQSTKAVIVDGKSYEKGKEIMTIKTDKEGIASTKKDVLPYGEYQISETKAPNGYLPEGEKLTQDFTIQKNGEMVVLDTEDTAAQNKIIRGGVRIEKWDYELHEKVPQGSATLAGAEFTITNESK